LSTPVLETLSDLATEAHTRIQQDFANINPVVGISRSMRNSGFPADAMTIDCLKTSRRIIIILHDESPEILRYQFAMRDADPSDNFEELEFEKLTVQVLYDWMASYFSKQN
jgi:hypothetical protein